MASFDIIEAASYGYQLAWQERRYLGRLATIPLFIKFCCLSVIAIAGFNNHSHFLHQAILMLPSYFADGWMLSHYTRLIFLDQRWPFRPSGDPVADRQEAQDRASDLMAGTLVFAVSYFLVAGIMYVLTNISTRINLEAGHDPTQVSFFMSFTVLAILAFCFWGFRFLWFFIPATLGYSLRQCLIRLRGSMTSLLIFICVLLFCYLPAWMLSNTIAAVLSMPYASTGPQSLPVSFNIFSIMLTTLTDTIVFFIATGAMSYAMYQMLGDIKGPANDPKGR
jgi:hypothetical protein